MLASQKDTLEGAAPMPTHLRVFVFALLLACSPGAVAEQIAAPFRASPASVAARSLRGILVVLDGQPVVAENAQQLFVPASVLKLVVGAAALHYLGPGHQRVTTLAATGAVEDGVLRGDLVLQGAGDPTWSSRFHPKRPRAPLQQLARQLWANGVRRVSADLVVDASLFPGPEQPMSRPLAERAMAYGAPCSAVAVDESTFGLRIAPGKKVGQRGTVTVRNAFVRVENGMVTVGRERSGRGNVSFYPGLDGLTLRVQGEYPVDEPPYDVRVSVPDPNLYAAEAFASVLRKQGVQIDGVTRVVHQPVKVRPGPALARIESPPLGDWLPLILQKSHNWYAEMLLRVLALEQRGQGRLDVGLDVEREFLEEVVGIPADAFHLDDASGLSPYNLMAPEAVVALLDYARGQSWRDVFSGAMAAPGKGTLRNWPKTLPLRAKTGTIESTVSLGGYIDVESGDPMTFAVFLNHWPKRRREARAEVRALVKSWVQCREVRTLACGKRIGSPAEQLFPGG
jgi:D-alanyl-D-alanine carboxypeptidase/D-alanyl-D-alanine-endopeptidase (penicillin-binding protein 4)